MRIKLQKKAVRAALSALIVFSSLMLSACGKREALESLTDVVPTTAQILLTESTLPAGYVEWNGSVYCPREDLTTILLMGLDKAEMEIEDVGYTNTMQSDFLMLLVVDEQAKVCDILHLNRDTMTEIPRLGIGGASVKGYIGQLTLAHTYGSGGSDSSLNAVKAVSKLLKGVKIDHYMTLTMDAVGTINDAVGGVTVELPVDMTAVDPAWEKGKEVKLMGEQALWFVRARMSLENDSNLNRMERQELYLNAFYDRMMACYRKDDAFLMDILLRVSDLFTSDLTVTQLDKTFELLADCERRPFRSLEGELKRGEKFYEFYVDEDSLHKTVMDMFYTEYDG